MPCAATGRLAPPDWPPASSTTPASSRSSTCRRTSRRTSARRSRNWSSTGRRWSPTPTPSDMWPPASATRRRVPRRSAPTLSGSGGRPTTSTSSRTWRSSTRSPCRRPPYWLARPPALEMPPSSRPSRHSTSPGFGTRAAASWSREARAGPRSSTTARRRNGATSTFRAGASPCAAPSTGGSSMPTFLHRNWCRWSPWSTVPVCASVTGAASSPRSSPSPTRPTRWPRT